MTQLTLDELAPAPEPNPDWFHPDGSTRLLLWPGDDVRMMHERTSGGSYLTARPVAGCCSAGCPVCNPDAFRCRWGCCPPGVG